MPRRVVTECLNCGKIKTVNNGQGKYCSNACQLAWQRVNVVIPKFNSGKLSLSNGGTIIKQLLAEAQGGKFCSCCGLSKWNDQEIPLDVDHVNGDNKDNRPENLRLLCPNCHRLTETWGNSTAQRNRKKVQE